jgi:hypothetical protein
MLTLHRTGLVLALLIAAPTARAADLVIEGKEFAQLRFPDVPALVTSLPSGASITLPVILPIDGRPRFGPLEFRLDAVDGGPLVPGIYVDLGCSTASGTPSSQPTHCATGTFEVFAVRHDAEGRVTRLLFSFESFAQPGFGELRGRLDFRSPADGPPTRRASRRRSSRARSRSASPRSPWTPCCPTCFRSAWIATNRRSRSSTRGPPPRRRKRWPRHPPGSAPRARRAPFRRRPARSRVPLPRLRRLRPPARSCSATSVRAAAPRLSARSARPAPLLPHPPDLSPTRSRSRRSRRRRPR